jgi:hypothetical protein
LGIPATFWPKASKMTATFIPHCNILIPDISANEGFSCQAIVNHDIHDDEQLEG